MSIMDPQTCVVCKKVKQHVRVLRCLHTVCRDCILVKTSAQNTILCMTCSKVTPAPSNGKSQLLTLPVYKSPAGFTDGSAPSKKMCVECMEDTKATSSCVQCKVAFCAVHAAGHPLSKVTWKHSVVALGDDASRTIGGNMQQVHSCAIHLSSPLISYCYSCNELLCAICQSHSPHTGHEEEILSIADAAGKNKQELARKLEADQHAGHTGSIEAGLSSVSEAMTVLNDRTEQVSSEIKESFNKVRLEIEKREKELLTELGELRRRDLQPLDEQRMRLSQSQNSRRAMEIMFENCGDDVNLLRLSPWLQEALDEHTAAAKKDSIVHASSNVVYDSPDLRQIISAIQTQGRVYRELTNARPNHFGRNFQSEVPVLLADHTMLPTQQNLHRRHFPPAVVSKNTSGRQVEKRVSTSPSDGFKRVSSRLPRAEMARGQEPYVPPPTRNTHQQRQGSEWVATNHRNGAQQESVGNGGSPASRTSTRPPDPQNANGFQYSSTGSYCDGIEPQLLEQHVFPRGVQLRLCQGDITQLKVDAIVNAANDRLQHGGGVASAISLAGGPAIQRESDELIQMQRSYRPLDVGDAVYTGSGRLPCRYVIHTVGPIWSNYSSDRCETQLTEACHTSLMLACDLKCRSVALPPISSGIFGMPPKICARVMLKSIFDFCSSSAATSGSLKCIELVVFQANVTHAFCDGFKRVLSRLPQAEAAREQEPYVPPPARNTHQQRQSGEWVATSHRNGAQRDESQHDSSCIGGHASGHKKEDVACGLPKSTPKQHQHNGHQYHQQPSHGNKKEGQHQQMQQGKSNLSGASRSTSEPRHKVRIDTRSSFSSQPRKANPASSGDNSKTSRVTVMPSSGNSSSASAPRTQQPASNRTTNSQATPHADTAQSADSKKVPTANHVDAKSKGESVRAHCAG